MLLIAGFIATFFYFSHSVMIKYRNLPSVYKEYVHSTCYATGRLFVYMRNNKPKAIICEKGGLFGEGLDILFIMSPFS